MVLIIHIIMNENENILIVTIIVNEKKLEIGLVNNTQLHYI